MSAPSPERIVVIADTHMAAGVHDAFAADDPLEAFLAELCADAGLPFPTPGPKEEALRRACGRLLHVDDRTRWEAYGRQARQTYLNRFTEAASTARLLDIYRFAVAHPVGRDDTAGTDHPMTEPAA